MSGTGAPAVTSGRTRSTGYRLGVPTWEYASVITANDAESQRAGVGTIDCVTGELLAIDPALCEVAEPLPLPVGCPPRVEVPVPELPGG